MSPQTKYNYSVLEKSLENSRDTALLALRNAHEEAANSDEEVREADLFLVFGLLSHLEANDPSPTGAAAAVDLATWIGRRSGMGDEPKLAELYLSRKDNGGDFHGTREVLPSDASAVFCTRQRY